MTRQRFLSRGFFARNTVYVAPDLLGKYLVRVTPRGTMVGQIVEVEAYRGKDDPASHAFRGPTPRNAPMFGEPGHAYIYFTYGNHYCLNFTTQRVGVPGAVLIRALQPVEGISLMKRFRPNVADVELTSGPGKLTKALWIDKSLNEQDLTVRGPLFVVDRGDKGLEIARSTRIGVGEHGGDKFWRFFVRGNPYISRRGGIREMTSS